MSELDLGKSGLKTAIGELHDPAAPVPDNLDGEQLALLPLENAHVRAEKDAGNGNSERGVGRPRGAKNKNTKEWRDFLLSRYSSPLVAMAEVMSRPVDDLARELLQYTGAADGSKVTYAQILELLKVQLSCAKELMPYLHQKQPVAIEAGEGGLMQLNIFSAPQKDVQNADGFSLEILDTENEQNQGVIDIENEKLNAEELNACEEMAENCTITADSPTDTASDRTEGVDHE